ncbi:MAG TPA: hydrogenase maturation nickel metallochaperone HypA [Pedococcus sp.]|jgi:hydrogenase nickel incorporation protein HypA/HybF|nr:hydrogenase maturation nickel metallochaperone HypA [Pedococcus sp.]
MHELSLCEGIYAIVDRASDGRRVEQIHLRVGRLRQVVPQTLVHCWGLLTESTELAGSQLTIEDVPIRLRCMACGEVTQVEASLDLTCAACGNVQVEVVAGEELMVTSLELGESRHEGRLKERHG